MIVAFASSSSSYCCYNSDDIQAELLTIVGKPPSSPFCNVMISPSPVYRTLNPLPHNTSFATAAVFTVVAAAATTATTTKSGASEDVADWHPKQPFMTTRQRSHSVGDDRRLAAATAY